VDGAVVPAVVLDLVFTVPVLAVAVVPVWAVVDVVLPFCVDGEEEQPATANDPTATRAPARHLAFIGRSILSAATRRGSEHTACSHPRMAPPKKTLPFELTRTGDSPRLVRVPDQLSLVPGAGWRVGVAFLSNKEAMVTTIDGWVAPGFEAVREAFQQNFDEGAEVGAGFAAYHRGKKVADLWGGIADEKTGRPWDEDTLVLVYSTTKGATAMCANRLAQQRSLDMEAPVSTYWPEFAQAGKEQITVAQLLSHRAGLAWTDGRMSFDDAVTWTPVIDALQRQAPSWPPGSAHGYHATTYGWLVGEVVRRVSGRSLGTYLRDEITGPLGAEFFVGLPPSEQSRVARLVSFLDSSEPGRPLASLADGADQFAGLEEQIAHYLAPDGPLTKALGAPGGAFSDPDVWDDPRLHAAEIPAANGICDARSLARLYGACVSEVGVDSGGTFRILTPEQLDRALVPQTEGPDVVLLGLDMQWGLGFMLNRGMVGMAGLGGPRSFGHFGMGGSAGWADPDLELGMGYVMNRMSMGTTGDMRSFRLMQASIAAAREAA
jgi:CubicO group peptidase (beta-lactamase class C family)